MGKISKERLRALKFLLFSISAGVIEIISHTLFLELFALRPWLAQVLSLSLSVLWNFTFNRRYTFQSANNVPIAMLKVAAFYLVFTPLTSWLTDCWTELWGYNEYIIKVLIMLSNFVLEFFYQKYFVFRNSIDTNELAKKP